MGRWANLHFLCLQLVHSLRIWATGGKETDAAELYPTRIRRSTQCCDSSWICHENMNTARFLLWVWLWTACCGTASVNFWECENSVDVKCEKKSTEKSVSVQMQTQNLKPGNSGLYRDAWIRPSFWLGTSCKVNGRKAAWILWKATCNLRCNHIGSRKLFRL